MSDPMAPIRRFPVSAFPLCLGLLGVGLMWRAAAGELGAPGWIGEAWLGLASMLLLFCAGLYAVKIGLDPDALIADLAPPMRGGAAALSMSLMLLGAGLAPIAQGPAIGAWVIGALLHWVFAGVVVLTLLRAPPGDRAVGPDLLLPFAGQIVAPLGGAALGFGALSTLLFAVAIAAIAAIGVGALRQARGAAWAAPGRRADLSLLAAAPALAALAGRALGVNWAPASALTAAALGVAIWLALRARWLLAGGWTPAWGVFGFALAALAHATIVVSGRVPALAPLAWGLALLASAAALALTWRLADAARKGALFD